MNKWDQNGCQHTKEVLRVLKEQKVELCSYEEILLTCNECETQEAAP